MGTWEACKTVEGARKQGLVAGPRKGVVRSKVQGLDSFFSFSSFPFVAPRRLSAGSMLIHERLLVLCLS